MNKCTANADRNGAHSVDDDAAFTPAPRASTGSAAAGAWRRVLLLVLRRYSGRLAVRGKLLNQEELLVTQLHRLDNATAAADDDVDQQRVHEPSVCIPAALGLRFIVRCEDGPIERVGSDDVVARIETSALAAGSLARGGDTDIVAVVARTDEQVTSRTQWQQPLDLTAMQTLFGFDVRALLALATRRTAPPHNSSNTNGTAARIAPLADGHDDCANAAIARTSAFCDLRSTQMLLERIGLARHHPDPQQQHHHGDTSASTTEPLRSLAVGAKCRVTAAHARSYVALANAQKRMWAAERVAYGRELLSKARVKDAVAEFSKALELDAACAPALKARSDAFVGLQQFRDAVRDLEALQAVDATFPQLDDALARARSKLRHVQRVDVVSSELPVHPPLQQQVPKAEKALSPPPPVAGSATHAAQRVDKVAPSLEAQRLRRLLEAEVAASARAKRKQRSRSDRSDSRDSCSDSRSDSSRDRRAKRHKKTRQKKSKKKKKAKKKTKHKRRRHHDSSDSSDSDSGRSSRRSRHRHASDATSRSRSRASRSRSRSRDTRRVKPERRAPSPLPTDDAPHPILARQRHRIWN